jgi:hypothetical protein
MVADTAAVIGAIAAVVAAVAAVPAAMFSVRAFYRMRQEGQAAERRHVAQIQPRPLIANSTYLPNERDGSAALRFTIFNPGGAATSWVAFIQAGEHLFVCRAPVTAHYRTPPDGYEQTPSTGKRTPPTAGNAVQVIASYALDVDGNGWDVLAGMRAAVSVIEYLRERLAPLGIALDDQGNLSARV